MTIARMRWPSVWSIPFINSDSWRLPMNPQKFPRLVSWCVTLSLLFAATFGILVTDRASAKSGNKKTNEAASKADKVSSDLRTRVKNAQKNNGDGNVNVILQFNGPASGPLTALLNSN